MDMDMTGFRFIIKYY